MSSRCTYVLACDGAGCDRTYVGERRNQGEVRSDAAVTGWTHRWRPPESGPGQRARCEDLCPACSEARSAS